MKRHIVNRLKSTISPLNERVPPVLRERFAATLRRTSGRFEIVRASARGLRGSDREKHGPLTTIVVPIYNVEDYLAEFLASAVVQTYANLEVLVVDDGSPDRSIDIARRWARLDRRIRIIRKPNGGLGSARNVGIDAAHGEYITFADSDDTLTPDAIRVMVSSLQRSGSDFVVGTMRREQGSRRWTPKWAQSAHREDRFGITIENHPEILLDVFACNKLWRTDFFREHIGGFPEGIAYEDQEPSVKSYLNARRFDVIRDPVYYWKIRDDGSSITQQKATISNLSDRLEVTKKSAAHILSHPSADVRREWYVKTFDVDLIQYVEQVPRTDSSYFDVLSEGYRQIIAMCEPTVWQSLPMYARLATLYTYRGDVRSLSEVISGRIERGDGSRLLQVGSSVISRPGYTEHLDDLPDDSFFEIDPSTVPIVTRVSDIAWLDGSTVRITGSAFARSDFANSPDPQPISASLVNVESGEQLTVEVETFTDPNINRYARSSERDCRTQGFTVSIDTSQLQLRDGSGRSTPWKLMVSVRLADGTMITDRIQSRVTDGGASVLGFAEHSDSYRAVVRFGAEHGLFFSSTLARARTTHVEVDGRTVSLGVESLRAAEIIALMIHNRRTGQRRIIESQSVADDGHPEFRFELPSVSRHSADATVHHWRCTALFDDGRTGMIALSCGQAEHEADPHRAESVSIAATRDGDLQIAEEPYRFTCDEFGMEAETNSLIVSGRIPGRITERAPDLVIEGPGGRMHPETVQWEGRDRRYTARFVLEHEDWAGNRVGLPRGGYTLRHLTPRPALSTTHEQWATVLDADAHVLPKYEDSALNTLRFTRGRRGRSLWIAVEPRMREDEIGLEARYAAIRSAIAENEEFGLLDAVVFESYHGKRISDSTLSLFERMRTQFPDLEMYWSVNSPSVNPPAGSTAIVMGSSEWIRVVHRARYLMNNSNFPGYFRKQSGQRYVQTWHGTPLKRIAEDMPAGNLSLEYRSLMRREVRYWDLLLAQNPFAAQTIAQAFRYTGPVLDVGYPRNDLLARSADRTESESLRTRLGIRETDFVVMFAPTFRDGKNTSGSTWMNSGLDFDELLSRLPDNTTLLLRGHSNTSYSAIGETSGRVIDVGNYGEISELFLITDVLVTDYSSMMFDFVVTGKPIMFFVPDLEEYSTTTRGFYLDFNAICPGPMYATSSELGEGLARAHVEPDDFIDTSYREFVSRFAPHDDGSATERVLDHMISQGWFDGTGDSAGGDHELDAPTTESAELTD